MLESKFSLFPFHAKTRSDTPPYFGTIFWLKFWLISSKKSQTKGGVLLLGPPKSVIFGSQRMAPLKNETPMQESAYRS